MKPNPPRDLSRSHQEAARTLDDAHERMLHAVRAGDLEGYALTVDAWEVAVRAHERAKVEAEIDADMDHYLAEARASSSRTWETAAPGIVALREYVRLRRDVRRAKGGGT